MNNKFSEHEQQAEAAHLGPWPARPAGGSAPSSTTKERAINDKLADVVPLQPRPAPAQVTFRYTNEKMPDARFNRLLAILFTEHDEPEQEQAAA
ncbi:hypothetical protein [Streptomyces sp. NPDC057253]|uniref:hypothetical protein n=1 Tax=Streptomyces sp. NPDC057253 TaxID=3346069 RepID=UPI00363FB327